MQGASLSVHGDAWQGMCRAGETTVVVADVVVMVRPQNVRLAGGEASRNGARMEMTGEVVQASVHGARCSVTVDVNGRLMKADVPAMAALSELVTLTIDERTARAMAS
jgi:hypothetical protein